MPELPHDAGPNLAAQALENLVNQFARPLDFLRELVQNAIDAETARVEVWVRFHPPEDDSETGVLEIGVDDYGSGMDEAIIDGQLTRMFSSNKEDDLTKIGKFGIGFTSIFAIQPEAVMLRTGRHGESWELLFHTDRSYDKVRIDEPIVGTHITLYKRMEPDAVPAFVREARWVLTYWCMHSNTPITFEQRPHTEGTTAATTADPFAAFAADGDDSATAPERINRPLTIDAPLQVHRVEDKIEVVVGYADQPQYGFYNGGLTLLDTTDPDALGDLLSPLAHLTFKVKYDALEHTLTRDNVLQDDNWRTALAAVMRAAVDLRMSLVKRTVQAVESGEQVDTWQRLLAEECRRSEIHRKTPGFGDLRLFVDHFGGPLTSNQITEQESDLGTVLIASRSTPLNRALASQGFHLLPTSGAGQGLASACHQPSFLRRPWSPFSTQRQFQPAGEVFALPQLVDIEALPGVDRDMIRTCSDLLDAATRGRLSIRVGEFGGANTTEALAMLGPTDGSVFQRSRPDRWRLPSYVNWRCLLINRQHPHYQTMSMFAAEQPTVAAFALAQAILGVERLEDGEAYERLLTAAADIVLGASP